jgi:hypothetical protein
MTYQDREYTVGLKTIYTSGGLFLAVLALGPWLSVEFLRRGKMNKEATFHAITKLFAKVTALILVNDIFGTLESDSISHNAFSIFEDENNFRWACGAYSARSH